MRAQARKREAVISREKKLQAARFFKCNSKEKLNEIDRFPLAKDVIARVPGLRAA